MSTERTVALVRDDTIVNMIVVDDDTPADFLDLVTDEQNLDEAIPGEELPDGVAIGHIRKPKRGFVPPIEVTVEANRVIITDNRRAPATELAALTGPLNPDTGLADTDPEPNEHTVPVAAGGKATINVPEATPDAPVVVAVPALGISAVVRGPAPAKAAAAGNRA